MRSSTGRTHIRVYAVQEMGAGRELVTKVCIVTADPWNVEFKVQQLNQAMEPVSKAQRLDQAMEPEIEVQRLDQAIEPPSVAYERSSCLRRRSPV